MGLSFKVWLLPSFLAAGKGKRSSPFRDVPEYFMGPRMGLRTTSFYKVISSAPHKDVDTLMFPHLTRVSRPLFLSIAIISYSSTIYSHGN